MNPDGIQKMIMGRANQFGRLVCSSLDNSTTEFVGDFFAYLGFNKRWMNSNNCLW
jgi:hypothetical protein